MDEIGKLEKNIRENWQRETVALAKIEHEELQNFATKLKEQLSSGQRTIETDIKSALTYSKKEIERISVEQITQLKQMGEANRKASEEVERNMVKLTKYAIIISIILFIPISLVLIMWYLTNTPKVTMLEIPKELIQTGEDGGKWLNLQRAVEAGMKIKIKGK